MIFSRVSYVRQPTDLHRTQCTYEMSSAVFSYVRLAFAAPQDEMHIRNEFPAGVSYVRQPYRHLHRNAMHIRNELPAGVSYVRWPSQRLLRSEMHIRNELPAGVSYVRRHSQQGPFKQQRVSRYASFLRRRTGFFITLFAFWALSQCSKLTCLCL
jgi:hypothetical protein